MNTIAVAALLTELGAHTPSLPRARCRDRAQLFDAEHPSHTGRAIEICLHSCPELARCRDWLESLPKHRLPAGVVAGRRVRPPPPRRLPQPKPKQPSKTDRAADWLTRYLAAGPVISTQVRAAAVTAGIDLHTLTRARRHLGVQLERTAETRGGQWMWTLPRTTNNGRNTMTALDQFNHQPPDDTPIMGVENHGFSFIVNHQDIDVFGLIIYARDWGSMCFALTDEQAYHVAEGLLMMVRDRAKLRAQYNERNPRNE